MLPDPVFTVNRNLPSWVISTQHGAVWLSANGEAPIGDSAPSQATLKAETVPRPVPLWALETNSWNGLVGRNSLPKGPSPWAVRGDPGAALNSPPQPTEKLSIWEVPVRLPTSVVPIELNSTSSGCEPLGTVTVEPGSGWSWPQGESVNPVKFGPSPPALAT